MKGCALSWVRCGAGVTFDDAHLANLRCTVLRDDLFNCVRPADGECRTENFLKWNGGKQCSILLLATQPVDLPSVNLERVCVRPQRVHMLFQLLVQIIRQKDDVALPSFIELRLWKRPVISDFG